MPDSSDVITIVAYILAGICFLLLIPIVLPVAVATNFKGAADRLSGVPGISEGGGATSGVTVVVILLTLAVPVAVGMNYVGFGPTIAAADAPEDGAASTPTATVQPTTAPTTTVPPTLTSTPTPTAPATSTPTPTPTPTPMPTPTPTPTPTATPTVTPTPDRSGNEYAEFRSAFRGEMNRLNSETLRIEGEAVKNGTLIVAHNATGVHRYNSSSPRRAEWIDIIKGYIGAIASYDLDHFEGPISEDIRIVETNVTAADGYKPKTTYLNNTVVREFLNDERSIESLFAVVWENERPAESSEFKIRDEVMREEGTYVVPPCEEEWKGPEDGDVADDCG